MTDVDREIARAQETMSRLDRRGAGGGEARMRRQRQAEVGKRLGRIVGVDVAILIATMVIGWIMPIGMGGFLLMLVALIVATLGLAIFPLVPEPTAEKLVEVPLKVLPMQTEQWLIRQRASVPVVAHPLLDAIGAKLDTLAPQVSALDEGEPAAAEIRKLIGEQLPELLKGYAKVPEPLRRVPRNGATPDQQLVDSLRLIDSEIAEMSAQLAQGDLDSLATRGRYLQIKYRDDEVGG
jgi:hypothetical protein